MIPLSERAEPLTPPAYSQTSLLPLHGNRIAAIFVAVARARERKGRAEARERPAAGPKKKALSRCTQGLCSQDRRALESLKPVVHVLGPRGIGAVVQFHGGVTKRLAVHSHHRLAALLEFRAHPLLDVDDLGVGPAAALLQHLVEDLLVGVRELVPG